MMVSESGLGFFIYVSTLLTRSHAVPAGSAHYKLKVELSQFPSFVVSAASTRICGLQLADDFQCYVEVCPHEAPLLTDLWMPST
jgi:hypothetical protein